MVEVVEAVTAAYVHFPFCLRKCAYCDFNSRPGSEIEQKDYLTALLDEINQTSAGQPAPLAAGELNTVYFGGGTPTLYGAEELAQVLQALEKRFGLAKDAKISIEANPGTVSLDSSNGCDLRTLHEAGFNRLSLGVQSLRDDELKLLGRIHSAAQARQAVNLARQAGFENLSVDLMRGLPGQILEHWQENLEAALTLDPEHISAYGLSLEEGTPLLELVETEQVPEPEGNDDPQWVRWTVERLAQARYERYEVSNFARPGFECRHNLVYWRNQPYWGFGAGAWSFIAGQRQRNMPDVTAYIEAVQKGEWLIIETETLAWEAALGETIMLGLRLTDGVDLAELSERFGCDVQAKYADVINKFIKAGLLQREGTRIFLTFEGMLWQNKVAVEFL